MDLRAIEAELARRSAAEHGAHGAMRLDDDALFRALSSDGIAAGLFSALLQRVDELETARREQREPAPTPTAAAVLANV
jgi:hypothetical protein